MSRKEHFLYFVRVSCYPFSFNEIFLFLWSRTTLWHRRPSIPTQLHIHTHTHTHILAGTKCLSCSTNLILCCPHPSHPAWLYLLAGLNFISPLPMIRLHPRNGSIHLLCRTSSWGWASQPLLLLAHRRRPLCSGCPLFLGHWLTTKWTQKCERSKTFAACF